MTKRTPFLRWAGGKRWIAARIGPLLRPLIRGRYIEPFLGSGALFFELCPDRAILGDLNRDLIGVFLQVRDRAAEIEEALRHIPVSVEVYSEMRESRPSDDFTRAVRFIYLNRTCYGGLYRTNRGGTFNVPYGGGSRTPEAVYRDHLLIQAAGALAGTGIEIRHADFQVLVDCSGPGDVLFCDPTYRSAGRGRFDRYGPDVFSWEDQQRLATAAREAKSRGAVVVIMNIDDPDVRALYDDAALIIGLARKKAIGNPVKDDSWHREVIAVFSDETPRDWASLVCAGNQNRQGEEAVSLIATAI